VISGVDEERLDGVAVFTVMIIDGPHEGGDFHEVGAGGDDEEPLFCFFVVGCWGHVLGAFWAAGGVGFKSNVEYST
jgi:hypothetical protein